MRLISLIILLLLNFCLIAQEPPPPPPPPGVKVTTTNVSDTNAVHPFAEKMPQFPGGQAEFTKYLQMNIHYPDSAKKYGREGTVYVYFVVNKDGRISDVKCMRGVGGAPELTEEAIRVIQAMPQWEPGRMNGKAVNVGMTVPIRFQLQ